MRVTIIQTQVVKISRAYSLAAPIRHRATSTRMPVAIMARVFIPDAQTSPLALMMLQRDATIVHACTVDVPLLARATMMRLQDVIMVPAYSPVAPMSLLVTIILQRAVMMAHVFCPMVAPTLQLVTLTLPLYATMAPAYSQVVPTQRR